MKLYDCRFFCFNSLCFGIKTAFLIICLISRFKNKSYAVAVFISGFYMNNAVVKFSGQNFPIEKSFPDFRPDNFFYMHG